MTKPPGYKAADALLGNRPPDHMIHDAFEEPKAVLHNWPDLNAKNIEREWNARGAEVTPTDEQHDKAELARWLRVWCIGQQPMDLRTTIGKEALDLIIKALAADLAAIEAVAK